MTGTRESQTSSAHLQVQPPHQASPYSLPPFPQVLPKASPIVYAKTPWVPQIPLQSSSVIRFYILPQTYRGAGTPGSPDRRQTKDWRCNGAGSRFGDTSVGSTLEKEATTDGGLPSQLLLCSIFPDLCLGKSAGRQSQPHLSALVPGICVPPCKGNEDKADLVLGCASCK